ncbi:hypothetical protein HBN50_14100 [Halobacteriovorax sp. GB3]|uniref:hypothetical protein n=1 Tax=Halobacteriovorax sp. GB3 TaxID=2719615 RepID=UPI002360DCBA|nr:hypothetical protein [Halobacteriovorax sp. GB3]MDD0854241.1 hypothetical protein [Halobacteriovorax sp. GB3]
MYKKVFAIGLFLVGSSSFAKGGFSDVLSYSLGMVNHSVTENASELVQTDDTVDAEEGGVEASSSAVSAISFQLNWEFKSEAKKSYFMTAAVPMMTTGGAGVFTGGVGMNWYLNDLGTKYTYLQNGTEMTIIPSFKYYWGASTGLGYVVYNTESAKKSDVFFDLGVHGGGVYSISDSKGIKAEIGVSRATGVATSGIKFNIFFGMTQYL